MGDIIQLLPDAIANQIAAGEVVQRPASAVKEMLENAIDAGATNVQLIIKDAGKTLIQVVDNGKGMSEMDARMCFERHATSKIRKTNDLFNLHTYGFRGEAMASIAAVAQVELKTKRREDELGTFIKMEASKLVTQEETACNDGSSIAVKNLFYNVPARRNFLKSNPVETRHIVDEFQRVALAYPNVAMQLYQNDLETFHLPSGKLSQRIVNLFGKSYQQQLAPCKEEVEGVKVYGYIGKPQSAKKTRGEQFFYANDRFIKHPYLNHAVVDAYEGLIPKDSFPFYILKIEIMPDKIDINVHPTKTEIKFEDERMIYGLVKAAVKKALGVNNLIPSIDFDNEINFPLMKDTSRDSNTPSFRHDRPKETPQQRSNKENWVQLFENFEKPKEEVNYQSLVNQETDMEEAVTFQSTINIEKETALHGERAMYYQLHQKYIVSQVLSGLLLVNQQAAHERVLYEKYLTDLEGTKNMSQQCLFPATVTLNPADYALVHELKGELLILGFQIEDFGNNSIIIQGMPLDLQSGEEKEVFEGIIEQFKHNSNELQLSKKDNLARTLARRVGKKEGNKLHIEEMKSIVDQLFACQKPDFAPDGAKTYTILSMDTIGNLFN